MKYWAFPLSVVLSGVLGSTASSFDFNLKATAKLEAEVGLDAKTKKFLQGYPAEVREQIKKALQEALPLIDQSVEAYINQVNAVVRTNIDNVICGSTVPVAAFFEKLNDILPGEYKSEPVKTIRVDHTEVIAGFTASSTPVVYKTAYSDFLHRAAMTSCQAGLSPEAVFEISTYQQDIRPRWGVWVRLEDQCPNAPACFDWLKKKVEQTVASADTRDASAVRASDRISTVLRPPEPSFFDRLSRRFSPTAFEDAFVELYSIEDGVHVSNAARQASANTDFEDGVALVNEAAEKLASATLSVGSTSSSVKSAIELANSVQGYEKDINAHFARSLDAWDAMTVKVDFERKRYFKTVDEAKLFVDLMSNLPTIKVRPIRRNQLSPF